MDHAKKRIAAGSGTQIQDVNRVLKQHKQMQKMMKKVTAKGGHEENDASHGRYGRPWWPGRWWYAAGWDASYDALRLLGP